MKLTLQGLKGSIKRKFIHWLIPPPVPTGQWEYSMLFPADDDRSRPSSRLISLSLEAVKAIQKLDLNDVSKRMKKPPYYPDIWPGEHYKLLAALVQVISPRLIVEVGTGTGRSALSMKKFLPDSESRIVSFDLIDWKRDPEHEDLFKKADLIFIDAAKDGLMEQTLLNTFQVILEDASPFIVFDDIRLWNMLKIWRNISLPKLDLTSFGHCCRTGLVEWR